VQFEVTLPEQVEYSTGIVRYQELVSLLKENIRKYATDSHFQDVDNVGRFEPNKQQRGVDVTLKATFVRQDR
ncbi:MAG: hypothetical protein KDB53_06745, partial [Planctomycetes bacterium]|nr:hypothetical protein [Planctomycetota bacterium]